MAKFSGEHEYTFQLCVSDITLGIGPGSVAQALVNQAQHYEALGWEVVNMQVVNEHYGLVFARRKARLAE